MIVVGEQSHRGKGLAQRNPGPNFTKRDQGERKEKGGHVGKLVTHGLNKPGAKGRWEVHRNRKAVAR